MSFERMDGDRNEIQLNEQRRQRIIEEFHQDIPKLPWEVSYSQVYSRMKVKKQKEMRQHEADAVYEKWKMERKPQQPQKEKPKISIIPTKTIKRKYF